MEGGTAPPPGSSGRKAAQRLRAWARGWKSHLLTLALVWLMVTAVDAWRLRDLPRGPAPATALVLAPHGQATTLQDWRAQHPGRAVALHFWAEWCAICRIEEPTVAALSADWPVLGIAMQSGDVAQVARVQQQRGHPWPTAVDPRGQLSADWGVRSVPALVVMDASGRVRFATSGYTAGWSMRLRLWWAQTVPAWG